MLKRESYHELFFHFKVMCFVLYKSTIKFMKNLYIYIYIFNDIFIIKMEHMQLMTTLIITYAIIFEKTNQIK